MGFEQCHPAINFIYFALVIYGMIAFQHPVFLIISFLCAFLYSVKRNGVKAVAFDLALLPLIGLFAIYYSTYTHFGVTVLEQNLIGNNITLESLVYGITLGIIIAGVMIWFSCIFSVFSSDKVVYLFGKVSPRLSLFLSILLRIVPRIKRQAKQMNVARRGVGKAVGQGNLFQRLRNCIRILSMLITWTIESLTMASESMQSRGSMLRGRKAFSIYRFDYRDRMYVVGMFSCMTVTVMGILLRQTDSVYNPRILITPITSMSYVFYLGYFVLCIMPLGLELWTEWRFHKLNTKYTKIGHY